MLVFIVVLNLFVEYQPKVITESFTISIFTAVVLKLLIDAIARLEHHVSGWFKRREGSGWRLLGLVTMFAILFFSKFVILEVIDIVFGDRVTLGGFIEVLVLVLTMILARLGLTWTYRRLGGRVRPKAPGLGVEGPQASAQPGSSGPAGHGAELPAGAALPTQAVR